MGGTTRLLSWTGGGSAGFLLGVLTTTALVRHGLGADAWERLFAATLQVATLVTSALLVYVVVTRHLERFKSRQALSVEMVKRKAEHLNKVVGLLEVYERTVDWVSVASMAETQEVAVQRAKAGRPLTKEELLDGLQHGFHQHDKDQRDAGGPTLLERRVEVLDAIKQAYLWLGEGEASELERRFQRICKQKDVALSGDAEAFTTQRDQLQEEAEEMYRRMRQRLLREIGTW